MVLENLTEVRENHYLNISNLNIWLEQNFNNFGKVKMIKQFLGGQSNPTFFIILDKGIEIILRKKPPGKLLPSAHAIEREYLVQKSLTNTSVPCPKMLALCEDSKIIGTPFYIMEYVAGRVYESILDIKSIEFRKSIYLKMVEMLANLHNIDYEKIGLYNFGKPGNYAQRQINRWEKQWNLSKQRELPEMDFIINWLNNNIPEKCHSSIVHGDYRLGNLIYDQKNDIQAVLDWELSTIGDPLADLGYMLYPYFLPMGERHGIKGCNLKEENLPEITEIVEKYCFVRKIKTFDPKFYLVLSMFRSVAILEGVFARYVNGNESSPNAKEIGKDVVPLAKATYNLIK
ncbi:MAG: putative aminoglycoside phosphotransferase [Alphaproteobacteria bacterium MarineAlpha9_Bin4]|mgnify:CR=1 FL=1|nr:phosphotransferase family protein [Pelagibacterales bacterium]PPR27165.1 MAG: putative aminoglycoside phosphotransferase [Alphaproteobacteria bacterium MarineAlpha9_Bin4]|tara:strand:- start:986 stop:2017 length:1032 start_codon:yes stop_codon:yes gene_type:complete